MEEKVQALRDLLDGTQDEQLDIPDELLDEIAGGLGSGEAVLLFRKMARAKKAGKSMEELIGDLKKGNTASAKPLSPEHLEEIETFIQRFW